MTVYFDHIQAPCKNDGTADPSVELMTWLSYKMIDWANKIGPNYVEVIDSHVDWQNAGYGQTNSGINYLTLQLKGPTSRAGNIPGLEPIGISFYTSSHLYLRKWRGITSLHGGTYGNSLFEHDFQIAASYNVFADSDFTTLKESFVLYGDTPGAGFFAWQLMADYGETTCGCIIEAEDNSHVPASEDFGWIFRSQTGQNFPFGTSDDSQVANIWSSNNDADAITGTILTSSYSLREQGITRSYHGAYMGHTGNRLLYGSKHPGVLSAITYNGNNYTYIGNGLWLNTDV